MSRAQHFELPVSPSRLTAPSSALRLLLSEAIEVENREDLHFQKIVHSKSTCKQKP
jgi:hypothetical protein